MYKNVPEKFRQKLNQDLELIKNELEILDRPVIPTLEEVVYTKLDEGEVIFPYLYFQNFERDQEVQKINQSLDTFENSIFEGDPRILDHKNIDRKSNKSSNLTGKITNKAILSALSVVKRAKKKENLNNIIK